MNQDLKEILLELQNQNRDLLSLFESLDTSFRNQAANLNIDFFNAYSEIYKAGKYKDRTQLLDKHEQRVLQLQEAINKQASDAKESILERAKLMDKNLKKIKNLLP